MVGCHQLRCAAWFDGMPCDGCMHVSVCPESARGVFRIHGGGKRSKRQEKANQPAMLSHFFPPAAAIHTYRGCSRSGGASRPSPRRDRPHSQGRTAPPPRGGACGENWIDWRHRHTHTWMDGWMDGWTENDVDIGHWIPRPHTSIPSQLHLHPPNQSHHQPPLFSFFTCGRLGCTQMGTPSLAQAAYRASKPGWSAQF